MRLMSARSAQMHIVKVGASFLHMFILHCALPSRLCKEAAQG